MPLPGAQNWAGTFASQRKVSVYHSMEACHRRQRIAPAFFVVSAYLAQADGRLVPDKPCSCPVGIGGEDPCRIVHSHWRERLTGPCHPLLVLTCRTHGVTFTVHPPGFSRYGRRPMAVVAPDGGVVRRDGGANSAFAGTIFQAALDARDGVVWCREVYGEAPWWGTQQRDLARTTKWLGVDPLREEKERELLAVALGVDGLLLRDAADLIRRSAGFRSRGEAVCRVLEALPHAPCALDRLAVAGHVAGLWGTPFRCDGPGGFLRRLSFRSLGTGRPP